MSNLISINDAAKQGIERLHLPHWGLPEDHIKIDILELEDGYKEPRLWAKLYSAFNLSCNGKDPFPICLLTVDCDEEEWEPYMGILPDSDEYKEKQEYFSRALDE